MMILVSACLAGMRCRYDGRGSANPQVLELVRKGLAIPVCPEQLGGLTTPRLPAEIQGGDGVDVLSGGARVLAEDGGDLSRAFLQGAFETLRVCRRYRIESAVLKARSPSCGCGWIYDGSFSGALREGRGVTAALLLQHGIEISSK